MLEPIYQHPDDNEGTFYLKSKDVKSSEVIKKELKDSVVQTESLEIQPKRN